jgi:triacylglycerol lipase
MNIKKFKKNAFFVFFTFIVISLLICSCKTVAPVSNENNIPLKYPVILVHGVHANDRKKIGKSWGRIPEELEKKGIKVFVGNTDGWGNYESNAAMLHDTIEKVLQETKSEKVNIIAHSKGGLDSRYCIWKYNYGNKVASLTTLSTPHHGAELADLINNKKITHSKTGKKALKLFGKLYGDVHPDVYNVNYQLTTDYMKKFNEEVGMDNNVYYQSIYSIMESPFDDLLFSSYHRYIKKVTGDNDGVVSEYSATWGENVTKIDGGVSHVKILDRKKKKKISGIYIPDIYLNIVTELSEMGF